MIYYAGIGSRTTPPAILSTMTSFARAAAEKKLILRSGGADGADSAFEAGCDKDCGFKEIFLPWKMFNKNSSLLYQITPEAYEVAAQVHPVWKRLAPPIRKLIARNMQQVLGRDLKAPVLFVVCWTPDGAETADQCSKETGGTGSAIILASMNNIPVFNLKSKARLIAVLDFMVQNVG